MNDTSRPSPAPARIALLLAVAWLAFWALMKLYKGSPNDLPAQVIDMSPWGIYTTFRGVVAIELAVVAIALLLPRLGWFILAVQYTVFLVILAKLIQAGAETCGCTGSVVKLAPWQMASIDGLLLLGLLVTAPWKRLPKTKLLPLRLLALLPLLGLAVWAPLTKFVPVQLADITAPEDGEDAGPKGPTGPETEKIEGDFYAFETESWEGQMIHDTDLARFLSPPESVDLIPPPALVVVYRKSCEQCAEHIANLATNPPATPIVLLRVPETDPDAQDVIQLRPQGAMDMELVELPRGYLITTPMSFEVDDVFMIQNVQNHRH